MRVVLVLLTGAILLGASAWKFQRQIARAPNLYWQWRCMRFTAPVEQVAYEDLDHVVITRDFLNDPQRYLRHLSG